MPRTTDATLLAALASGYIQPALFVQLSFNIGSPPVLTPVYLWSGSGNVTFLGQTWTGVGSLLGLTVIEDGSNVQARGNGITLSAFDATYLNGVLSEYQLGAPAAIYLAFYVSGSLYPTPLVSWAGKMDQPSLVVTGTNTATITIALEQALSILNVPCDKRLTNEQQIANWPGDTGLAAVDGLQSITVFWLKYPTNNNNV